MSFFMSADYSLSTKVMEIIYFIIGLLCIYCGVKNLKDKENPEPMGTFIFWAVLGVVLALGRWLPSLVSGILVVVMCIPAILKKVKKGAVSAATKAETEATYEKIGMKIFVPTLSIGMLAVICAITGLGIGLSALNGVALGVLVAIILLMIMNRDNKPSTFLNDSERMLSMYGVIVMFISGIVGYILDKNGFPTAPMLLAFVLAPMLEENMRKAFIASQGSLVVFTDSILKLVLLAIFLLLVLTPMVKAALRKVKGPKANA